MSAASFAAARSDEAGLIPLAVNEYRGTTVLGFLPFLRAWLAQRAKEEVWRIYMADCAQITAQNTARLCAAHGVEGIVYTKRLADMVYPQAAQPVETGDEVLTRMVESGVVKIK